MARQLKPRIRAVTFDADGTLWDFAKPAESAIKELVVTVKERHPSSAKDLTIADFKRCWERAYEKLAPGGAFLSEIRRQSFFEVLELIGEPDTNFAELLSEEFQRIRWSLLEVYADAEYAVRTIGNAGILTGVLTNGSTRIEKLNTNLKFDFTVYAEELGCRKPDKRVFEIAAGQAGFEPSEMAHVGDSYLEDVFGARNAGFTSIWLNMESGERPAEVHHDFEIATLRDLPQLIMQVGR